MENYWLVTVQMAASRSGLCVDFIYHTLHDLTFVLLKIFTF